jgi:regulator of protease activity HflC (stomatin/prohibitin superfamily)
MAVVQVPVTKGKGVVEVDTEKLPDDVYTEIVMQGLKTLVNRGMTKVTIKDLGSDDEVRKEAAIIAQKNVDKIYAGDIKFSGKATKTKVSGVVQTEAMRIAKERVKDALRANGYKLSNIKAAQITAAAKVLLSQDDTIIAQAEAAIEARKAAPMPIDIKSLVQEDAGLAAKNAAEAAEKKADRQLSATQAGKVKGRKPKSKPAAEHSAVQ